MRILVTGGSGQVGTELRRLDWPDGVEIVAPSRADLDLSDADAVFAFVRDGGFAAVVNPAAYTAVDRAESQSLDAFRVNALAPAALAQATREAGIPIVHVSTDYVFDGTRQEPYREDDPVGPVSVYGASKEAGEQAIRAGNPRHVILRTAWVFSPHGANFVKTMRRLGAERPALRVVDDQNGCPTAAGDIAAALATMTMRLVEDASAPAGTYHFVNDGATTWCRFAREILRLSGMGTQVEAIGTRDYPTPARRPANSVLSVDKLSRDFAIVPRPWQAALEETLARLDAAPQTTMKGA